MRIRQVINNNVGGVDSATLATRERTPTYSAAFPADAQLTLSDIAPGWNGRNGFLMVRYVCTTLPTSGSDYIMSINDGSSSNIIGFRLEFDTSVVEMKDYWRTDVTGGATNYSAFQNKFDAIANEPKTWILGWRDTGYKYYFLDDQFGEDTDTDQIPTADDLTTFTINGRNAAQDKFTGNILYVEFFDEYLTPDEAIARRGQMPYMVIATAGQSNIQNFEDGVESTDPDGRTAIVDTIGKIGSTHYMGEVLQIHAAEGGSGIWSDTAGTSEYWLTDTGEPGPELIEFFQEVDRAGKEPRWILWDQGETESHKLDAVGFETRTQAAYKTDLLNVFKLMRNKYPNAQIIIGKLGIRDSFSNTGGIQKVVNAQNELIEENSWIHFGWERFDLARNADGVHYDDAEYTTLGTRAAKRIAALEGHSVSGGTEGPKLVSASRSGTALTINIEHDGGTDFTPTSGIEGFYYEDSGGSEIALSSVARSDATTITATLASGVAGTLYYMYDNDSVTLANLVKDNGANTLPLQRGKVTVS